MVILLGTWVAFLSFYGDEVIIVLFVLIIFFILDLEEVLFVSIIMILEFMETTALTSLREDQSGMVVILR